MSGFTEHLCEVTVGARRETEQMQWQRGDETENRSVGPRRGLVQYSSGSSSVVTERSASVMIQSFSVSETG